MPQAVKFTYRASQGVKTLFIEEPESFLRAANLTAGVPIYDEAGEVIATVFVKPAQSTEPAVEGGSELMAGVSEDGDEVPGLTDEDREDTRDARSGMREEGAIPWEEIKAKLGI